MMLKSLYNPFGTPYAIAIAMKTHSTIGRENMYTANVIKRTLSDGSCCFDVKWQQLVFICINETIANELCTLINCGVIDFNYMD
jgi:hypothetical protein